MQVLITVSFVLKLIGSLVLANYIPVQKNTDSRQGWF